MELRRRFLGWTILERSCELARMALELGDAELAARFRDCARRVAPIIDVAPEVVTRIQRNAARSPSTAAGKGQ